MLARITARGSRGGREPGTCERERPSSKQSHDPSDSGSLNGLHSGASGAIMILFGYFAILLCQECPSSDSPGGSRVFLSVDLLSSGLCLSSVYRLAVKQLALPCVPIVSCAPCVTALARRTTHRLFATNEQHSLRPPPLSHTSSLQTNGQAVASDIFRPRNHAL